MWTSGIRERFWGNIRKVGNGWALRTRGRSVSDPTSRRGEGAAAFRGQDPFSSGSPLSSLSFCPLAAGEPRVGALFLVVGSLKSPFTGSQSAINEATMWLVTVGTYLAVSQVRFRSDWGGYQKGWAGWFLRQSLSG